MEFNHDNLKIWFSPDGKLINCTGSFFKAEGMSYDQVIQLEKELKAKLEGNTITRASDTYFLAVNSKLREEFENKKKEQKKINNQF